MANLVVAMAGLEIWIAVAQPKWDAASWGEFFGVSAIVFIVTVPIRWKRLRKSLAEAAQDDADVSIGTMLGGAMSPAIEVLLSTAVVATALALGFSGLYLSVVLGISADLFCEAVMVRSWERRSQAQVFTRFWTNRKLYAVPPARVLGR